MPLYTYYIWIRIFVVSVLVCVTTRVSIINYFLMNKIIFQTKLYYTWCNCKSILYSSGHNEMRSFVAVVGAYACAWNI